MAEIDTAADIEVVQSEGHLIVRIPLAGEVSKQWLTWFMKFLREQGPPAQVQDVSGRTQIVVSVPTGTRQAEVFGLLDGVRDLVAKANAAEPDSEAAAQTEAVIRDWWSRARG
jgi:Ser/Thr protein kinase RdoA (MazF antagonist)